MGTFIRGVGATLGVDGELVGMGVASSVGTSVGVGYGGAMVFGAGGAAIVAWIAASTAASVPTVGTATGVSISGCCVGAEEMGIVGGAATESQPIPNMAINVRINGVKRCILAPPHITFRELRQGRLYSIGKGHFEGVYH